METRITSKAFRLLIAVVVVAITVGLAARPAAAAQPSVGLGTADSFAVLAASTVTNTGPSVISGNVGLSPGTAVTGFPPGTVNDGTIHAANDVAAQAQRDVTTAYNDAAGRTPSTTVTANLGGQTLVAGVYSSPTFELNGALTLDAQGDPNAVFVFQAASTLTTATGSVVTLTNGTQACNVFWQIGSSATLGTNSAFAGTVLALTSVTANTGATVSGRLLARNAAVTLDSNTISRTACAVARTTNTVASDAARATEGTGRSAGTPGTVAGGPETTGGRGTTGGGGARPDLPVTGPTDTGLAAFGLTAIAVGALMVLASRQGRVAR